MIILLISSLLSNPLEFRTYKLWFANTGTVQQVPLMTLDLASCLNRVGDASAIYRVPSRVSIINLLSEAVIELQGMFVLVHSGSPVFMLMQRIVFPRSIRPSAP